MSRLLKVLVLHLVIIQGLFFFFFGWGVMEFLDRKYKLILIFKKLYL
jgi:hypothetical protein